MDGNRGALVEALRAQRRRQQHIVGILTAECAQTSCPVHEIRVTVRESPARRLVQPPIKCPRCGGELYFLTLE
jgi:hypothetical protein